MVDERSKVMSHFGILVVASDEDELKERMAPYYEGNEAPEYSEFEDLHDQVTDEWENGTETMYVLPGTNKFYRKWDEMCKVKRDDEGFGKKVGYEAVERSYKQTYTSIDNFADAYHGYQRHEETGRFGYWHNPDGYWDWYQIGGRWTGYLSPYLKDGDGVYNPEEDPVNRVLCDFCDATGTRTDLEGGPRECNACSGTGERALWPTQWKRVEVDYPLAGNVDWKGARTALVDEGTRLYDALHKAIEEASVDDLSSEDLEKATSDYNRKEGFGVEIRELFPDFNDYLRFDMAVNEVKPFGIWGYSADDAKRMLKPREQYLEDHGAHALFYAFVDDEGDWHSQGSMGMFGMSINDNDSFDKAFWEFVNGLDPKQRVYVVDCHS
jgi:hypothetical protein